VRHAAGAPSGPLALPGAVNFPAAYAPQDLWSLYGAPSSATGAGQHVAVITEGDLAQPQRDLLTFENKFGLPHVPWHQVQVGPASSDTSGDDEWDLDTQYSTGLAPNASQLDVYVGSSLANQDVLATINRWVTDDTSRQASFSAGECEALAFATGFTAALDAVLAQATAQGQSLFVSSGDTGVFCTAIVGVNGVPAGLPSVEYPASSPGAIGVGGTTVLGPGPHELAWYAGGGGSSFLEATPAFQQGAGGSFAGARRGVPDVALDADPLSGYRVIVNGQEEIIGGTSASAPAWQGIWARAQSAHGGGLGFAGPVIYKTEPASAYHDIVLGGNPAPATPGWDYVTGRGTPDIAAFVSGA
jgi:subtilase family serine protease